MRLWPAVLLLAIIAAACVWHRAEYWSWPWQGAPIRLTHCGREYERSARERSVPLREVTDRPLREAHRAPPGLGRRVLVHARCGGNIATVIFRDAGRGRVQPYSLLGGP